MLWQIRRQTVSGRNTSMKTGRAGGAGTVRSPSPSFFRPQDFR